MNDEWLNRKFEICYRIKKAANEFVQCLGPNAKPIVFISRDLVNELRETADIYYAGYEGKKLELIICGYPARIVGGVDQLYVGFEA